MCYAHDCVQATWAHVGDGSQRSEEIVRNLKMRLWLALLLLLFFLVVVVEVLLLLLLLLLKQMNKTTNHIQKYLKMFLPERTNMQAMVLFISYIHFPVHLISFVINWEGVSVQVEGEGVGGEGNGKVGTTKPTSVSDSHGSKPMSTAKLTKVFLWIWTAFPFWRILLYFYPYLSTYLFP